MFSSEKSYRTLKAQGRRFLSGVHSSRCTIMVFVGWGSQRARRRGRETARTTGWGAHSWSRNCGSSPRTSETKPGEGEERLTGREVPALLAYECRLNRKAARGTVPHGGLKVGLDRQDTARWCSRCRNRGCSFAAERHLHFHLNQDRPF